MTQLPGCPGFTQPSVLPRVHFVAVSSLQQQSDVTHGSPTAWAGPASSAAFLTPGKSAVQGPYQVSFYLGLSDVSSG